MSTLMLLNFIYSYDKCHREQFPFLETEFIEIAILEVSSNTLEEIAKWRQFATINQQTENI